MLRPARLLPPKRLLTPRSDDRPLGLRLGPATRRSGTYLRGTSTRWLDAASRTHHAFQSRSAAVTVSSSVLAPAWVRVVA